ncbi:MAG TPA: ABC transporter permease, partial [Bacillota bacterium]|nr:ABC transporter permease [Bacillota bacterium]
VLPMTAYTGAGLCNDIATGVFDRFRTLGFWQPAAVVGALLGDILRYFIAVLSVVGTGLLIGYRPEGGAYGMALGILLVVIYAFSVGWIFAAFGVSAKKAESISQNSMIFIYTSIFCSNIFVQTGTLPGWLQVVVNINPTSHVVIATRGLMDGTVTSGQLSVSVLICVGIILALAPFTFWLYREKK